MLDTCPEFGATPHLIIIEPEIIVINVNNWLTHFKEEKRQKMGGRGLVGGKCEFHVWFCFLFFFSLSPSFTCIGLREQKLLQCLSSARFTLPPPLNPAWETIENQTRANARI